MTTGIQKRAIAPEALMAALTLRDLTDPGEGRHAMQPLMEAIVGGLSGWGARVLVHRASPLTSVADNYDRLHYPAEGVARDARYTRYVDANKLLRTHSTAMIPSLLRTLSAACVDDLLLVCPGLVYRRDCIDRLHAAEPHQLDLWRLRAGDPPLGERELVSMIERVVGAVLPGTRLRTSAAQHPYTQLGRQIDVQAGRTWVEVGECGLASPLVLREAGLPAAVSGLAMGLGLDRLLMLRKRIDDIRLLRTTDPRVAAQLLDLEPYRSVSRQPAATRDLSIAALAATTAEDLGDCVRGALGVRAACVEELLVLSETAYAALPAQARARLGMGPDHKNMLVRVVLRDLERSLTAEQANDLRNQIYAAIHVGTVQQWAMGSAADRESRGS
jgi:phenylalanyl-tRNA synthetase alpha chain